MEPVIRNEIESNERGAASILKPYSKPTMVSLGDVQSMVQGSAGSGNDGGFDADKNHS